MNKRSSKGKMVCVRLDADNSARVSQLVDLGIAKVSDLVNESLRDFMPRFIQNQEEACRTLRAKMAK